MDLETVIGLEIHVQLKTKTKLFCGCRNAFDAPAPNTYICEVCTGQPGTLPVVNREAVEGILKTGTALGCNLPDFARFSRKHYFYPDLPKGYQITQYEEPFCLGGGLDVEREDGTTFRVDLLRIHLEEDAGKLVHAAGRTGVDLNRAGAPLMECVTLPCVKSPEDARTFLQELQRTMRALGVSDADMEKGQMRCDANISLRPKGEEKLYAKTELKNLNSPRFIERALLYEVARQTRLWEEGTPVNKETTRSWNQEDNTTHELRDKEGAADYRYFPEPDIPPFLVDDAWRSTVARHLPELPGAKRKRFREEYGLARGDVTVLAGDPDVADYFEEVTSELDEWVKSFDSGPNLPERDLKKLAKLAASWISTELFKLLKEEGISMIQTKISPENFAELLAMLYKRNIGSSAAQEVLKVMAETGGDPSQIVEERGLTQVSDTGAIRKIVAEVLAEHTTVADEFRSGKGNALQFLVGQVMKRSKGVADPQLARQLLEEALKNVNPPVA